MAGGLSLFRVWTSFVGARQRLVHHLPYSVSPSLLALCESS